MSWKATAYVKELQRCPDGAALSAGQKLLLFVLADYHNTALKVAWPSLLLLALESMVSESQARRYLQYLEAHCILLRIKPANQGSKQVTQYVFLALDAPDEQRRRLEEFKKGCHPDTLFSEGQRVSEGCHPEPIRVSEGCHFDDAYKEELRTKDLELELSTPDGAMKAGSATSTTQGRADLKRWLDAKEHLRVTLGKADWDGWLRSALLVKVMGGRVALVAIPPDGRIAKQAKARWLHVLEAVRAVGFSGALMTSYPDEHTRERMKQEYPQQYVGYYGKKKANG